jgi:hypothetical protein
MYTTLRAITASTLMSMIGCQAEDTSVSVVAASFSATEAETGNYLPDAKIVHQANTVTDRYSNTQANFRIALDDRTAFKSPWMKFFGLIDGVAGQKVHVGYRREAWTLGQSSKIVDVRMQYKLPCEAQVRDLSSSAFLAGAFEFEIPTDATKEGTLEYWFVVRLANGSEIYDSRFGQNYGVHLLPPACALVSFDADQNPGNWPTVAVQGSLISGGALCLSYDKARAYALGLHDQWYRGVKIAPSAMGYARYFNAEGNVINDVEFFPNHEGKRVALPVPHGAKRFSMWFRASEYSGKEAFDSLFGANYHFEVQ